MLSKVLLVIPAAWQSLHLVVMPLWLNWPFVNVLFVLSADTCPVGIEETWQVPQSSFPGLPTCLGDRPFGMMPPWNVLALTPSWHAAQDAVTPVWLKAEFLKLTPVIAEVMLVPADPT
jgi:hypothetical protein